jgi:hypothetical protein
MFCALLHSEGSRAAGGWDFGPTDRVNVTSWLVRRTRQTSKFVGRFFMTILRSISLAVLAATAIGAQAGLVTNTSWNTLYPGLSGVQFDVNSAGGVTIGLGAHAYKNGILLPNDGTSVFTAQPGRYLAESRANWSFDFFVDAAGATCSGCTVSLFVDTNPTATSTLVQLFNLSPFTGGDSWNMEMAFGGAAFTGLPGNVLQGTYDFNPYASSSTAFSLRLSDSTGVLTQSDITVNVPEPGGLALAGLALAGLALVSRRKA